MHIGAEHFLSPETTWILQQHVQTGLHITKEGLYWLFFLFEHLGYAVVVDGCYRQGYGLIGYQNGKIKNRDGKNGKTDQI